VGLVAGAGFAEFGNTVVCCDIDAEKIERLNQGEIPIYEPGLGTLVERNKDKGRLTFTTDIASAVAGVEMVFMAVGTPMGDDGRADLRALWAAGETVAKALTRFAVIVDKSTVPVGTAEKLEAHMRQFTEVDFTVASNPEFLKEGDAVNDFMKPDRVIIGTSNLQAIEMLRHLYAPFVRTWDRIMSMDRRSAELTKYAANSYLATRISFMNDMAVLCEKMGADVDLVRRGMGSDGRIGRRFLFPGLGYGGSCFPKDVSALLRQAQDVDMQLQLVEATERVNKRQKGLLFEKAKAHFGDLAGKTFAVWGLAFKPQTDDVREAPALVLVQALLEAGATVRGFDPEANDTFAEALGDDRMQYVDDAYEAVQGADALFLCTEWMEFRRPDFDRIKAAMREAVVFDGRNIYSPRRLTELGFTYHGVGRLIGNGSVADF
jgi:UDPglucose 6-dehydrogenase